MKQDEKRNTNWEMADPKPPVIQSQTTHRAK